MRPHLVLAALFLSTAASGQSQQPLTEAQRTELRKKADELRERNAREREEIQKDFRPAATGSPEVKEVMHRQICRAAIAAIMGRDPSIVQVTREQEGVIYLAYTRPSDGTRWENRCRVAGNRVTWATLTGRWRDDPRDERVTYEVKQIGTVTIRQTFPDGSVAEKSFALAGL